MRLQINKTKILQTAHPLIVVFEDFLDSESLKIILNNLESELAIWDHNPDIANPNLIKNILLNFNSTMFPVKDLQKLSKLSAEVSSLYFREKFCAVHPAVRKWEKNEVQPYHMDNTELNGTVTPQMDRNKFDPFPLVDLAAVLYINDDYKGGELTFPDLELEIKPKAGSLVVWAGSERHGVNKIEEGNRYTLITFLIKARTLSLLHFYNLPEGWENSILNPELVESMLPSDVSGLRFLKYN